MEEKFISKCGKQSPKKFTLHLDRPPCDDLPRLAKSTYKINQRFSTHVCRINKLTQSTKPVVKLGSTHLLSKNCNKIEENILRHKSRHSKNRPLRHCHFEKKTQLIINKPYYLQYFKPKTYDDILNQHTINIENQKLTSKQTKKPSIINANIYPQNDLITSQTNFLKPHKKNEAKSLRGSNSKLDGSKVMSSTFNSYMDLQKKSKKQFNKEISLYCRKELECYYQSLLKLSNCNKRKYKEGVETMLNLMDVASNQKVLSKQLSRFAENPTFTQFVQIYSKVVDANLRQNVMDFFDIIFEQCGLQQLDRQQFISLLSARMTKTDAEQITEQIFYQMDFDKKYVTSSDILTLCFTNDQFCMFMKKYTLKK